MSAPVAEQALQIPAGDVTLAADLRLPRQPRALVLFAHGSGSSRFSPRNRYVAGVLIEAGMATVLADLLTSAEEAVDEETRHLRFDIGLLATRLVALTDWLGAQPALKDLPLCCFGASTGAGAALMAAAERPNRVVAVVSRGGRPDLAGTALARVRAPTLLIVGGLDEGVIELNEAALAQLPAEKRLVTVADATHLFPEPGALQVVACLARDFLLRHLPR